MQASLSDIFFHFFLCLPQIILHSRIVIWSCFCQRILNGGITFILSTNLLILVGIGETHISSSLVYVATCFDIQNVLLQVYVFSLYVIFVEMKRIKEFPTATGAPTHMLQTDYVPDSCLLYHNTALEFSSSASENLPLFRDTFLIYCFLTYIGFLICQCMPATFGRIKLFS